MNDSILGIETLVLNITQQCNMMCTYCFASCEAGAGTYGSPTFMTKEVALRAVDFLLHESKKEKVRIVFFGGEPLLNFKLIKEIVSYGNQQSANLNKCIDYELITNGTLLTRKIIDYLAEKKIIVQVSLDGPKDIHDEFRRFPNGQGTHAVIIANSEKMLAICRDIISVRATITKKGAKCFDTIKYLLDSGFEHINLTPVYTKNSDSNLNEEDIILVNEEFTKYADLYLSFALEWKLLNDGLLTDILRFLRGARLDGGHRKEYFCGAGVSLFGISAEGGIFPCHAFVGFSEYQLGDLFSGISQEKLRDYRAMIHVDRKSKCSSCWAKWMCGGGCAYQALIMNGDISVPYDIICSYQKNIYRSAMRIYDQIYEKDPKIIDYLCSYRESKPLREKLVSFLQGDGL